MNFLNHITYIEVWPVASVFFEVTHDWSEIVATINDVYFSSSFLVSCRGKK